MQQNEPTGGGWLSFRLAAEEVERWRGCSWGAAQKAVIDACNKGELRWRRSSQGGPDVFDADLRRWLQQPVARSRATKKRDLAELAVKHLWPNGIPKELTNKQIVKQMADWIADYCKRNNQHRPDISPDTLLRAAGRKK